MAFTSKTTPDLSDPKEQVGSYWDALLGSNGFKRIVDEQYEAYMSQEEQRNPWDCMITPVLTLPKEVIAEIKKEAEK